MEIHLSKPPDIETRFGPLRRPAGPEVSFSPTLAVSRRLPSKTAFKFIHHSSRERLDRTHLFIALLLPQKGKEGVLT